MLLELRVVEFSHIHQREGMDGHPPPPQMFYSRIKHYQSHKS